MNANDEDRIKELLRQAMPPVGAEAEPAPEPNIDLWPAVLRRLDTQSPAQPQLNWVWFAWALLAGVESNSGLTPLEPADRAPAKSARKQGEPYEPPPLSPRISCRNLRAHSCAARSEERRLG